MSFSQTCQITGSVIANTLGIAPIYSRPLRDRWLVIRISLYISDTSNLNVNVLQTIFSKWPFLSLQNIITGKNHWKHWSVQMILTYVSSLHPVREHCTNENETCVKMLTDTPPMPLKRKDMTSFIGKGKNAFRRKCSVSSALIEGSLQAWYRTRK